MRTYILLIICILINGCKNDFIECLDLKYDEQKKITYLNNKKYSGYCKSFYRNDTLRTERFYMDGKDHGVWYFYFPNGKIQTEGNFNLGVKIGTWSYFHQNGEIKIRGNYNSIGNRIGLWQEFNDNGKLQSLKEYDNNGKIIRHEEYY